MVDDLERREDTRLLCTFCGESIEAQGNDPLELLLTSHYCPTEAPAEPTRT